MATLVSIVDDFDRSPPADENFVFVVDDQAYALDLCEANAQAFRDALAPWLNAAAKLGKHKVERTGQQSSASRRNGVRSTTTTTAAALPETVNGKPWYKADPEGALAVEKAKKQYRLMARDWARRTVSR